jgi:hypothetical protein
MSDFNVTSISEEEIAALSKGEDLSETPGAVTTQTQVENTETTAKPTITPGAEPIPEVSEEEIAVLLKGEDYTEDINPDPTKEKTDKEKLASEESKIDRTQYYKLLVESGEWYPVTDDTGKPLEDIELDDETFQELAIKQAQWKADEVLQEREQELGEQYKSFVEFMKNGGKVEYLARFEADQKDVESYDPTDPDQAEELIKNYQLAIGTSDKNTKSYIEFLKDKGAEALQEAAEEAKVSLVKAIQEERDTLIKEQEQQAKIFKESQEKYIKTLKEIIHKDSLPDREKKDLEKFYFDAKHPIDNGRKASEYFLKVQEIQSDPTKFLKLVKFIKDFESYEDKKVTEKEVTKKTFQLFRGSSQSKSTEFPVDKSTTTTNTKRPTTFDRYRK